MNSGLRWVAWVAGVALVASALGGALACTATAPPGADAAPAPLGNRATEQRNGSCPSPPRVLIGLKPPGAVCATAGDCKPVCCDCDAGAHSWLGAACEGATGTCANDVTTCVTTASAVLCP
jgi:hypothetical protein